MFIIKKPLHVQVIYWTFSFSPIWCHRWWIIFFFSGFYILPHIELIFQIIINIVCWTWWSSPAVVNYSPFCWHCLWIQRKWKGFKHPAYKNQVICSLLNYTQLKQYFEKEHLSPPLLLNAKWLISTQSVTADSNIEIKVRIANLRCCWLSNKFSLSTSWEMNWGHMENMLIEVRKLRGRLNESNGRITYTAH